MSTPKLTFTKVFGHWKTVRTHRKWARKYCFMAGIPWRGIKHDLSKYSPVEFWESARYWSGTDSPINACKKDRGYSKGWLHHKGRNSHHYEYWIDNFEKGGQALLMPKNDFTELVCDFLAAGRAYNKDFTYAQERAWWKDKRIRAMMNEKNKIMLDIIFSDLEYAEQNQDVHSPEELIKSGYIQMIWKANK